VTEDMPHPAPAGDLSFHDNTEDALSSGTVLHGSVVAEPEPMHHGYTEKGAYTPNTSSGVGIGGGDKCCGRLRGQSSSGGQLGGKTNILNPKRYGFLRSTHLILLNQTEGSSKWLRFF
jgi:hypothetical protein